MRHAAFQQTLKDFLLQLNKCETGRYFLQNFQCTTMFISAYCKICELKIELESEPEIVQKKLQLTFRLTPLKVSCNNFEEFQVHKPWVRKSYKTRK